MSNNRNRNRRQRERRRLARSAEAQPFPADSRCANVVIGAVVEKGKTEVVCFAHCAEAENGGARVRDSNFARQVLNRICLNEPGAIIEGWPDEREWQHLWHVTLSISRTRNTGVDLAVRYRAFPGCPFEQKGDMMKLYDCIRDCMAESKAKPAEGHA